MSDTADGHAERVARILGPCCAAAQAVQERDRRRSGGEDVYIWYGRGNYWVVGPPPPRSSNRIERPRTNTIG